MRRASSIFLQPLASNVHYSFPKPSRVAHSERKCQNVRCTLQCNRKLTNHETTTRAKEPGESKTPCDMSDYYDYECPLCREHPSLEPSSFASAFNRQNNMQTHFGSRMSTWRRSLKGIANFFCLSALSTPARARPFLN